MWKKERENGPKPHSSVPSWDDINTDWRDSSSCASRHSLVLRNSECVEQKGGMKKDRQGWELSRWVRRTAPNMRLLEVLREICSYSASESSSNMFIGYDTNNWSAEAKCSILSMTFWGENKSIMTPNKRQYYNEYRYCQVAIKPFLKLQKYRSDSSINKIC